MGGHDDRGRRKALDAHLRSPNRTPTPLRIGHARPYRGRIGARAPAARRVREPARGPVSRRPKLTVVEPSQLADPAPAQALTLARASTKTELPQGPPHSGGTATPPIRCCRTG